MEIERLDERQEEFVKQLRNKGSLLKMEIERGCMSCCLRGQSSWKQRESPENGD